MGLISALDSALARLGATRLHVLVVETPGSFVVRAAVEHACRVRGWPLAVSPGDADALLVCGAAPEGGFADAVEQLWSSLPGPRVRAEVTTAAVVPMTLNELAAAYRDWDATADPGSPPQPDESDAQGDEDMGHEDLGGMDADEDMGGMDEDMGGMDMDMSGPSGIALASGADDRDGLEMDVLHLPLGPVLAGWPPGWTVLVTLQGDVITEVEVQHAAPLAALDAAAYRLDAAAQLLALAGADVLAVRAGRARDVRLGLVPDGPDAAALRRSVKRSQVLRWALRHVGPIDSVGEHDWPAVWTGDAYDRLLRLLEPADVGSHGAGDAGVAVPGEVLAEALPRLLAGSELASARLTVASLVGLSAVTSPSGSDEVSG